MSPLSPPVYRAPIRQRNCHNPLEASNAEAPALLSQAQVLQQDHHQRLDAAQQLKKTFKYQEATEPLQALAADYPWDEQSRA